MIKLKPLYNEIKISSPYNYEGIKLLIKKLDSTPHIGLEFVGILQKYNPKLFGYEDIYDFIYDVPKEKLKDLYNELKALEKEL